MCASWAGYQAHSGHVGPDNASSSSATWLLGLLAIVFKGDIPVHIVPQCSSFHLIHRKWGIVQSMGAKFALSCLEGGHNSGGAGVSSPFQVSVGVMGGVEGLLHALNGVIKLWGSHSSRSLVQVDCHSVFTLKLFLDGSCGYFGHCVPGCYLLCWCAMFVKSIRF